MVTQSHEQSGIIVWKKNNVDPYQLCQQEANWLDLLEFFPFDI